VIIFFAPGCWRFFQFKLLFLHILQKKKRLFGRIIINLVGFPQVGRLFQTGHIADCRLMRYNQTWRKYVFSRNMVIKRRRP